MHCCCRWAVQAKRQAGRLAGWQAGRGGAQSDALLLAAQTPAARPPPAVQALAGIAMACVHAFFERSCDSVHGVRVDCMQALKTEAQTADLAARTLVSGRVTAWEREFPFPLAQASHSPSQPASWTTSHHPLPATLPCSVAAAARPSPAQPAFVGCLCVAVALCEKRRDCML